MCEPMPNYSTAQTFPGTCYYLSYGAFSPPSLEPVVVYYPAPPSLGKQIAAFLGKQGGAIRPVSDKRPQRTIAPMPPVKWMRRPRYAI